MEGILQTIAIYAIPLIFAITVHEVAHGWVAEKLGDPTARMMGRVTLNPIPHVDPVGTILIPFVLVISGAGILFGWARPVPVNFANLRRVRRDSVLVALAGPGSNFLQFGLWLGVLVAIRFTVGVPSEMDIAAGDPASRVTVPLIMMAQAGMLLNIWLGMLNLLPVPPLDGGRIVHSLLPASYARAYGRIEPFGILVLLALVFFFGQYLTIVFAPFEWILARVLS